MRWCFENTSTPYAEEVLEQLLAGEQAQVPVLWLYEVVSVLAKAQRTASITADKAHGFLEDLRSLDIKVDDESLGHVFGDVHRLAVDHGLSGYDAAYLELGFARACHWLRSTRSCRKPLRPRASNYFSQPEVAGRAASKTFCYPEACPVRGAEANSTQPSGSG
jgi:predicted nucleic acid-binding protein